MAFRISMHTVELAIEFAKFWPLSGDRLNPTRLSREAYTQTLVDMGEIDPDGNNTHAIIRRKAFHEKINNLTRKPEWGGLAPGIPPYLIEATRKTGDYLVLPLDQAFDLEALLAPVRTNASLSVIDQHLAEKWQGAQTLELPTDQLREMQRRFDGMQNMLGLMRATNREAAASMARDAKAIKEIMSAGRLLGVDVQSIEPPPKKAKK